MYAPIDLSAFPPEREASLKSMYRYSMFKIMLYRSNLWDHEHRVLWLAEELLPLAQKYVTLDADLVRTLAIVHDDAEIILVNRIRRSRSRSRRGFRSMMRGGRSSHSAAARTVSTT